jgi:hypothetical protein
VLVEGEHGARKNGVLCDNDGISSKLSFPAWQMTDFDVNFVNFWRIFLIFLAIMV